MDEWLVTQRPGGWWWPAPEANAGPAFWSWGCCYRCLEILVGHLIRRWRRYGRSIVSEHDLDWWWLMMIYGRFSIQSRSVEKRSDAFFFGSTWIFISFHHFSMLSGWDPEVLISIYLIPSNLFMTCVFPTPMRARGCGLCDSDDLKRGGGNGSARNPYLLLW